MPHFSNLSKLRNFLVALLDSSSSFLFDIKGVADSDGGGDDEFNVVAFSFHICKRLKKLPI